jgi:hypothetical protein
MRKMIVYLLLGFLVMFLFTYIGGLYDDAFTKTYYTGTWYKDIIGSFKYYVLWVLPYWWLMIIIGSIVLGAIIYGIKTGIGKLIG